MKISMLLSLLLLSACGPKGIHFDLSKLDPNSMEYAQLYASGNAINKAFQSDCLRINYPDVYPLVKDADKEFLIKIIDLDTSGENRTAFHQGGVITVTRNPGFTFPTQLQGLMAHEVGHGLGYEHPKNGQPGYIESAPERIRVAVQACK